jgi:hypothetical protein
LYIIPSSDREEALLTLELLQYTSWSPVNC